jgi:hypothetical protein
MVANQPAGRVHPHDPADHDAAEDLKEIAIHNPWSFAALSSELGAL